MIRRSLLCAVVAATTLFTITAARAQTTEVGGVKFENTLQVGTTKLQLNGAGVRYKAVFKVYAAGLYLAAKASTPDAVLAASGPRLLQIVMLREIDGNELGKLFTKGMEQNAPREDFSKAQLALLEQPRRVEHRQQHAVDDFKMFEAQPLANHSQQGMIRHGFRQAIAQISQNEMLAAHRMAMARSLGKSPKRPMASILK